MQMILQKCGLRFRQAAGTIVGEQRLEVAAVADVLRSRRRCLLEPLPHASGGRFDHSGVRPFLANCTHGVLQDNPSKVTRILLDWLEELG